jgi:hypothetical protein
MIDSCTRIAARALLTALGVWVAVAPALKGQAADAAPQDSVDTSNVADSVQLIFEREVFTYPTFERRDPFRPLTGDESSGGPRFEDLVLLGVVLSPNARASVAVIGARPPGATSDQAPTRTFRLRPGESIGNVRVIDVRRREIVVEVADFGARDTRTLSLRRPLPVEIPVEPALPEPAPAPDSAAPPGDAAPSGGAPPGALLPDAGAPRFLDGQGRARA